MSNNEKKQKQNEHPIQAREHGGLTVAIGDNSRPALLPEQTGTNIEQCHTGECKAVNAGKGKS